MSQTRQLAAIMFTDIVGYTALMGDVEENAFNLLDKNRKLQKPIIESYGGKWIKELGDGVLATFSTVSDAVYCALAIQQGSNIDPDLNLRIGIHLGEVVFQDGDVFGDGVNIASRLESLAPTGGIWVSEAVSRNIQNKDGIETLFVREEELKNVKDPVKVYEIRVEGVVLPTPRDVSRVSEPTKQKSFNKVIYLGLAIFIFAFILYLGYSKFYNSPAAADVSIAVLAFADMSPNKDQEYFSDGISEELLNLLSKTPELRVISRTSSFSYKGKDYTAEEIGRELKVTYLLEGSIRKSENTIRITAQLINAIDGSHIWSETYDRDLEDVFNIQDEIGAEVTKKLQLTILGIQPKIKTVDTEAYTMYLKARHLIHQNTKQAYLTAENIIKQSLEVDSSYAPSWELLGYIYNTGSYNFLTKPKAEAFELGIAAVQKAIELDPKFSEAYASLASLYEKTWEFEEAKKILKEHLN